MSCQLHQICCTQADPLGRPFDDFDNQFSNEFYSEDIGAGLNKLSEATGLLALPFSFAIANREFVSGFVGESGMLSHGFSGMRQCERCQDPFAKRRNKPHEHLRAHLLTTPMEGMSDAWTPLSPDLCYVLQANAKLDTAPAFN